MLRAGIVVALVAASVGLAGCAPSSAPTPTPTPLFTSEAEAFKAAEQVFRDYIDAENALQNGDKGAAPDKFLIGEALDQDIQSKRNSTSDGTKILGVTEVTTFAGSDAVLRSGAVTAAACLDVSRTRIVDKDGNDVTPSSRPLLVSLDVKFISGTESLKIIGMSAGSESCS